MHRLSDESRSGIGELSIAVNCIVFFKFDIFKLVEPCLLQHHAWLLFVASLRTLFFFKTVIFVYVVKCGMQKRFFFYSFLNSSALRSLLSAFCYTPEHYV